MALNLRRVVTGHDKNGKAIVTIDEQVKNVAVGPAGRDGLAWSGRPRVFRSTMTAAPTNRSARSAPRSTTAPSSASSSSAPACSAACTAPIRSTTPSSCRGEIDMELDDSTVHLKAGDVLVQRGTIHNWVNRGTAPCTIAFILIAAKPATAGGKVLARRGLSAGGRRRLVRAPAGLGSRRARGSGHGESERHGRRDRKDVSARDEREFLTLHEFVKARAHEALVAACGTISPAAPRPRRRCGATARRSNPSPSARACCATCRRSIARGTLFGKKLRIPVMLAPVGSIEVFDEGGAGAAAKAAQRFGAGCARQLGERSPGSRRRPRPAPGGRTIFQLYVRGDRAWVDDHVRRAIGAGYEAFCLTIDTAIYSRRERDLGKRYRPRGRRAASGPRVPGRAQLGRREALQGQVHDPADPQGHRHRRGCRDRARPRRRRRSTSRTTAAASSITAAARSRCCPRSCAGGEGPGADHHRWRLLPRHRRGEGARAGRQRGRRWAGSIAMRSPPPARTAWCARSRFSRTRCMTALGLLGVAEHRRARQDPISTPPRRCARPHVFSAFPLLNLADEGYSGR